MKKYIEVYQRIKENITSGATPYGSKLLSKRVIADRERCSLITVEHALDILLSEGYVVSRERSGYYVAYTTSTMFGTSTDESVEYDRGERTESFPFSVYSGAVRFVLNEYGERVMQKSPNSGCDELKTAIKNYLKRNRDIDVDTRQIIIGSGAEQLYGQIIDVLGCDEYAIEKPSYLNIASVYRTRGVKTCHLTLRRDGIDSAELWNTSARVLHVTPFRSYPTGFSATASKKQEYIRWARERNGYVVEDDYSSEFDVNGKINETLFGIDRERVIYLNTFSMTLCNGIRVGYMILPDELIRRYYEEQCFSCSVPTMEQLVIAKLLNDGSFERHLNKMRRKIREKTQKNSVK